METRLPREKDDRCKLNDEQIDSIPSLREKGMTYKAIGELFGVSFYTIYMHANPEYKYKQNHKTYLNRLENGDYELRKKKYKGASVKTEKKKRLILDGYAKFRDTENALRRINKNSEK